MHIIRMTLDYFIRQIFGPRQQRRDRMTDENQTPASDPPTSNPNPTAVQTPPVAQPTEPPPPAGEPPVETEPEEQGKAAEAQQATPPAEAQNTQQATSSEAESRPGVVTPLTSDSAAQPATETAQEAAQPATQVRLTHDRVVAAVRRQMVEVEQIPEGEFARDFPLPLERREALITAVGAELFPGAAGPKGDDLTNLAANMINVGKLIDLFAELASDDAEEEATSGQSQR